MDVLQLFDALIPVAEQVIDVPKIFIERIPPRTSVREPQLAEQLVQVPTIVSFSSLQRIMEQTVDIPVPQSSGRHADQGFLRGQVSSRSLIFLVEVFIAQVRVHLLLMSLVKGFFAIFPVLKKSAKLASQSGSELFPESSPSTRAAQLEDSVEWVRLREKHAGKTYFWNRRANSTVWRAPAGVEVVWYGEKDERGSGLVLAQGHACLYV